MTPHQLPAPPSRRIFSHAGYELRVTLRNGEQLLLSLILPSMILVFLSTSTLITVDAADRVQVITPGVFTLAVMSSAFTGQAIATGFERRAGALRMFATTPLGRGGLLGGKVLGVVGMQVVQVIVLGAIAIALGWEPAPLGIFITAGLMLLGTGAFTALGLLLAGTLRAEAVLAAANILWVLLMVGGGSILPGPAWTSWLPSGALGDALREALTAGTIDGVAIVVLTGWMVTLSGLTMRFFRWA